jgi:hypothetical protein
MPSGWLLAVFIFKAALLLLQHAHLGFQQLIITRMVSQQCRSPHDPGKS